MEQKGDEMINIVVILILVLESVMDIKSRTIRWVHMVIFAIGGIAANCILKYQSIWSISVGVFIGIMVFLFGILSRGAIGSGDGVVFACLGIYLGGFQNIRLLFYSLIVAAISGGIYVLIKRKSIKSQIPFVPCILVAYVLMFGMEVIA